MKKMTLAQIGGLLFLVGLFGDFNDNNQVLGAIGGLGVLLLIIAGVQAVARKVTA
jgi:hypothetical protein